MVTCFLVTMVKNRLSQQPNNVTKPAKAGTLSPGSTGQSPGLIALNKWLEQVGIAPVTAWRFRKKGWLRTVNICGRVYITQPGIEEFTARAAAGEFAQEHKTPRRFQSQLP